MTTWENVKDLQLVRKNFTFMGLENIAKIYTRFAKKEYNRLQLYKM